ncbi:MAG TPA: UDP-N-acetylmuramoyl-L-alanine--D-glutamate ligase [Candidatus Hydrogenedentes bacterium]|nr:UDP-N-acetylmuramoyl-L-alanine--D-glutamate ligase [Candidatus Hydrogenedentota bacterium]HPG68087.1 UDP-N-acetylmuramoyl-L-alanine--D-glutamate ligase [Candidatus Hydrogenedentota bacterium]
MDIRGKRVLVGGMARTGLAAVRLLLREGAIPFVSDSAAASVVAEAVAELEALGVAYECGGHSDRAWADAALVVLSPGVPPRQPWIDRLRQAGVPVMSELELAYGYCRSRVLAVTGTNGKTTTTELLRFLVAETGHSVALAGNNAVPFSRAVTEDPAPEFLVLEVSSYQLESACTFRPWIGAVLNVTPDHLARHHTMQEYVAVKNRLFAWQQPGDVAVLNADDPSVAAMETRDGVAVSRFSRSAPQESGLWMDGDIIRCGAAEVARRADIPLPGDHNVENVLAALAMMRAGGFDWERTIAGLRAFQGVEHRIEFTASLNGVDFYNDSKSTNLESLRAALLSFDRPIVLIAGGRGKGSDYGVLGALIRTRVVHLITLGEDAPLLEAAFGAIVKTERAGDMADAVARAARAASPGDVVLLSPACASFDLYNDFEHRGRVFKDAVHQYIQAGAADKRN